MLPTLWTVRTGFPNSFITAAASSGGVELFAAYRLVDEVLDLGVIKGTEGEPVSAVFRVLKLMRKTRRRRFDLTIDFAPRLGTQVFSVFSRGRTVVPIVRLPDMIDTLLGGKHGRRTRIEAASASIMRQLELKPESDACRFQPSPDVSARFEEFLHRQGFRGGEPLIVLYSPEPGSSGSWPVDRFGEVAGRLANNYGVRILAADQPYNSQFTAEAAAVLPKDAIKLRSPRAVELVAAVARASLVITDDASLARFSARLGSSSIDIGGSPPKASSTSGEHGARVPAAVKGGILASPEDVYSVACELLQKSRTSVLFQE